MYGALGNAKELIDQISMFMNHLKTSEKKGTTYD